MESQTERYIKAFGDSSSVDGVYRKDSRLAKAYEVALDIRKFEIDLYWKRSGSFWLLVGAIAAALGLLLSGKAESSSGMLSQRGREVVCCLLCFSGATICYAWGLVNKGSKFWQRNWEYQVGILEQQVVGPLYKTVISAKDDKIMYSVSEINGYISRYFFSIFSFGALALVIGSDGKDFLIDSLAYRIDYGTATFLIKAAILFLHVWFILRIKKESGHSREIGKSFDSEVEVSIRKISIEKIFGACKVDEEVWGDIAKKNESVKKNKVNSFFKKFFGR